MCSLERIVALLPWCSFVRPSVCLSVCLSVWDGRALYVCVYRCMSLYATCKRPYGPLLLINKNCNHTVHFSLWLVSPMFWAPWAPWHQACSPTPSRLFQFLLEERCGMDVQTIGVISQEQLKIEVKLLLSASRKSYMPRRLAQQRMTLSDLEWPFHASRTISAVAEILLSFL